MVQVSDQKAFHFTIKAWKKFPDEGKRYGFKCNADASTRSSIHAPQRPKVYVRLVNNIENGYKISMMWINAAP